MQLKDVSPVGFRRGEARRPKMWQKPNCTLSDCVDLKQYVPQQKCWFENNAETNRGYIWSAVHWNIVKIVGVPNNLYS